jgi:hypothetical protein
VEAGVFIQRLETRRHLEVRRVLRALERLEALQAWPTASPTALPASEEGRGLGREVVYYSLLVLDSDGNTGSDSDVILIRCDFTM